MRDEDELEYSDQMHILTQFEQHKAMIPLSCQHMATKKDMVKTIYLNSLPILDQISIPANELVVSQLKTYVARKDQ